MKKIILVISTLLIAGIAHADYNNPSDDVKRQLEEATLSSPVVQAILAQSAKEVGIALDKCSFSFMAEQGEIDQSGLNGQTTIKFNCNAGDKGSRFGEISGAVYGSSYLLSSAQVQTAG